MAGHRGGEAAIVARAAMQCSPRLARLELDVLQAARQFRAPDTAQMFKLFKVSLEQFHGIEIEEFPAQVAQVAMWLTQPRMDLIAGEAFGEYFRHLPLEKSAHVRQGNALRLDWEAFVPPGKLNYILGNPPFVGAKLMNDAQREDFAIVAKGVANAGLLDYVAAWYLKAAQDRSGTREGFVSPGKRRDDAGLIDLTLGWDEDPAIARQGLPARD